MPDGFSVILQDSLQNLVTGLGTARDRSAHGRFVNIAGMTREETDAIYRCNWVGGKIVDLPADDMVREWRTWNTSKANIEAIEEVERLHAVQEKLNRAWKMASKDGGALLVMGFGDDPQEPLNPNAVPRGGLRYLHVVNRWDVSIEEIDRDPQSPWFMQPTYYRMHAPDGAYVRIHPSRTCLVINTPRLDVLARGEPWGDSLYERVRAAVRDATAALMYSASLFHEAKVDVFGVPELGRWVADATKREALVQRFSLANVLKSVNNAILKDTQETWEQKQISFTGFPEMIDRLLLVVCAAADMPVTRLLGRSPAGLNATGEADLEAYYSMIRSKQQTVLRPIIATLDQAIIRTALGRTPRGIFYDWRPLWSISAEKQAEINLRNAQAVKQYADTGMFKRQALAKAVINQLQDDGFLGTLGELGEAAVAPEPPPEQAQPAPRTPSA